MDFQLPSSASLQTSSISKGIRTNAYTDLDSLNAIKNEESQDEALKKVAKQFESLFVHELMKNMRNANKAFEDNSLLDNKESNFFRDMYDQQLSVTLSERGMGLSDVLYQQMKSSYGSEGQGVQSLDHSAALRYTDKQPPLMTASMTSSQVTQSSPEKSSEIAPVNVDKIFESADDFIESILPIAKRISSALGLDPLVMVAQSALETGWGKHIVKSGQGDSSNNLFNIKADSRWDGEKVAVDTLEYRDGVAVKEKAFFRKYSSIEEGMNDFLAFISENPRYQKAVDVAHDSKQFIENLQSAGYATDPKYAQKILSVLQGVSERISGSAGEVGGSDYVE